MIGVMVYSFAPDRRRRRDECRGLLPAGQTSWFRLHEKGGKRHDVPAHHKAEEYLDAYLAAAGIVGRKEHSPLPHARPASRQLTDDRH